MENKKLKQSVRERKYYDRKNLSIAFILGVLIVIAIVEFIFVFKISPEKLSLISLGLFLVYFMLILILVRKRTVRVVKRTEIIEKPLINEIIREIESPSDDSKATGKNVRFKYVASNEGSVYHLASSRLARLIRPKNRIYSDDSKEFEKKGYKPSAEVLKKMKEEKKKLSKKKLVGEK
jgi:hypothetical protein